MLASRDEFFDVMVSHGIPINDIIHMTNDQFEDVINDIYDFGDDFDYNKVLNRRNPNGNGHGPNPPHNRPQTTNAQPAINHNRGPVAFDEDFGNGNYDEEEALRIALENSLDDQLIPPHMRPIPSPRNEVGFNGPSTRSRRTQPSYERSHLPMPNPKPTPLPQATNPKKTNYTYKPNNQTRTAANNQPTNARKTNVSYKPPAMTNARSKPGNNQRTGAPSKPNLSGVSGTKTNVTAKRNEPGHNLYIDNTHRRPTDSQRKRDTGRANHNAPTTNASKTRCVAPVSTKRNEGALNIDTTHQRTSNRSNQYNSPPRSNRTNANPHRMPSSTFVDDINERISAVDMQFQNAERTFNEMDYNFDDDYLDPDIFVDRPSYKQPNQRKETQAPKFQPPPQRKEAIPPPPQRKEVVPQPQKIEPPPPSPPKQTESRPLTESQMIRNAQDFEFAQAQQEAHKKEMEQINQKRLEEEKKRAEEREKQDKINKVTNMVKKLPAEPEKGITIAVQFPSGERKTRKFAANTKGEYVYAWAASHKIDGPDEEKLFMDSFELRPMGPQSEALNQDKTLEGQGISGRVLLALTTF